MTRRDDTMSTGQQQAAAAHQRLHQIAQLAAEYAELADRTGNGDLTALVFQVQLVLGDDNSSPSQPHSSTDAQWVVTPTGDRTMPG